MLCSEKMFKPYFAFANTMSGSPYVQNFDVKICVRK